MRIKIFQINEDRDKNQIKFENYEDLPKYQGSQEINSEIYNEVFSGEVSCENLEDVFTKFNTTMHALFRGHSMAVSDIVKTDDGFFFCDNIGFQKVDFDESKAFKEDNLLKVIYVEPGMKAYVTEMERGLEPIQRAVGGCYQGVPIGDKREILCNEKGKLKGMYPNRYVKQLNDIIVGPFVVVGSGREDYKSLTDEQIEKTLQEFGLAQKFTFREGADDIEDSEDFTPKME